MGKNSRWIHAVVALILVRCGQNVSGNFTGTNPIVGNYSLWVWQSKVLAVGAGTIQLADGSGAADISNALPEPSSIRTSSFPKEQGTDQAVDVPVGVSGVLRLASVADMFDSVLVHQGASLQCISKSQGLSGTPDSISLVTRRIDFDGGAVIPSGKLDLGDFPVLVANGQPSTERNLRAMLFAGATEGQGIISSTLAPHRALAYGHSDPLDRSSEIGTGFVIRQAQLGDADLNSSVTKPDFYAVTHSFAQPDAFWTSGDFTYDGVVDTLDYNVLAANLSPKSAREITADMAAASASPPDAAAPTPEPSSAAIFALGALALLARAPRPR